MTRRTPLVKSKFCNSDMALFSVARVEVLSRRGCLAAAVFLMVHRWYLEAG